MAFTNAGTGPSYWYNNYADDEYTLRYEAPPNHQRMSNDKEWSSVAFRHQYLPTSTINVNRSYHNAAEYPQGLAPSLTHPFPMEHSLDGQYSPLEWTFNYEVMRTVRYMSPNGPHGGSFSDSSASSESAYTPDVQAYPIRFSQSPVNVPRQYPFKPLEHMSINSTPWISEPSNTYAALSMSHDSTYTQSKPSLSPKDLEFQPVDDLVHEASFDEGIIRVHEESPMQRPEPEELDLTSINTGSITSSLSSIDDSDCEQVEEDPSDNDSMAIDDNHSDSDPDYDNRPRRRTNSRSTTGIGRGNARPSRSPRQARRSSNQGQSPVIDKRSRVRKSGSSSSTLASTSTHTRKLSKSKLKSKKPDFVKRLELTAKQEPMPKLDRHFPCTFHHFGCTSEFPNKNEWKRHVAFQHLQLGYYRCDMDNCNPDNKPSAPTDKRRSSSGRPSKIRVPKEEEEDEESIEMKVYNDFNRKDLFTQHCRRMHGPSRNPDLCSNPPNKRGTLSPTKEDNDTFEEMLDEIRQRCWNVRRQAPARSSCGFCTRVFDAEDYQNCHGDSDAKDEMCPEEKAWEARMEHIGKHYEKDRTAIKDVEDMDEDLKDWGLRNELLHVLPDGRAWLINATVSPMQTVEDTKTSTGNNNSDTRTRHPRKATRRPSKTVEYHVKMKSEKSESPFLKTEDIDSDDDAEGESDHTVN